MWTKQRLLDRAELDGLQRLTGANPTSQCPAHRGARTDVPSSWSLDGLAELPVCFLHFVCNYGRCAPGPLPYLLLAICSTVVIEILAAGAARVRIRKSTRNQDMARTAESPKGWVP